MVAQGRRYDYARINDDSRPSFCARPATTRGLRSARALTLPPNLADGCLHVRQPAEASGLSIGANSTVKLGDALLALGCNDLQIEPAGTLQAQASTIRLSGNWDNRGTFDAGTGTVLFEDGCVPNLSSIGGSSTFFDLQIMTSIGKTVEFEAGATQTVLDGLTLMALRATFWSSAAATRASRPS